MRRGARGGGPGGAAGPASSAAWAGPARLRAESPRRRCVTLAGLAPSLSPGPVGMRETWTGRGAPGAPPIRGGARGCGQLPPSGLVPARFWPPGICPAGGRRRGGDPPCTLVSFPLGLFGNVEGGAGARGSGEPLGGLRARGPRVDAGAHGSLQQPRAGGAPAPVPWLARGRGHFLVPLTADL